MHYHSSTNHVMIHMPFRSLIVYIKSNLRALCAVMYEQVPSEGGFLDTCMCICILVSWDLYYHVKGEDLENPMDSDN